MTSCRIPVPEPAGRVNKPVVWLCRPSDQVIASSVVEPCGGDSSRFDSPSPIASSIDTTNQPLAAEVFIPETQS
jgi:hypothetical protein